ncbi:hypothetical protein EOM82_07285 [bacterium]|nr:hypothetical protein [bacterium]
MVNNHHTDNKLFAAVFVFFVILVAQNKYPLNGLCCTARIVNIHFISYRIINAFGAAAIDKTSFAKAGLYNAESKVIDRTGAGDSFGSAFVLAYAKGMGLKKALIYGGANSDGVVQKIGAKTPSMVFSAVVSTVARMISFSRSISNSICSSKKKQSISSSKPTSDLSDATRRFLNSLLMPRAWKLPSSMIPIPHPIRSMVRIDFNRLETSLQKPLTTIEMASSGLMPRDWQ